MCISPDCGDGGAKVGKSPCYTGDNQGKMVQVCKVECPPKPPNIPGVYHRLDPRGVYLPALEVGQSD